MPGKNIRHLGGKPLIQWTIEAAQKVASISKIHVSTDCEKIAHISKNAGLEVPALRPSNLAKNDSTTVDVIKYVVESLGAKGEEYDFILLLQPTSPFRNSRHIQEAIDLMRSKSADAVISVCKCDHSPLWAKRLKSDLSMSNFLDEDIKNLRSQDLPDYYRLNGAIYLVSIEKLFREGSLLINNNIFGYEMDNISSVDIDNELDFLLSETIVKRPISV